MKLADSSVRMVLNLGSTTSLAVGDNYREYYTGKAFDFILDIRLVTRPQNLYRLPEAIVLMLI